jgi:putative hemolysin
MEPIAMASLALLAGFSGGGEVDLLPSVGIVLLLLCCSAFFSGSESALFSLDSFTLDKLEDEPSSSGKAVSALLAEPRRLLATLLLGNEVVNIALSSVAAAVVFTLAGPENQDLWWLNIVVVTPLLLIFGEVAPKAIAVRTGIRWARLVSLPLTAFATVFAPLRLLLEGAARLVLLLLAALGGGRLDALRTAEDPLPDALKEAQFRALVRIGADEGAIDATEAELINRVFDLTDTAVSKLMTARVDIQALGLSTAGEGLIATAMASGFSRLPVYAGELDHVRGILLLKDLLRFRARGEDLTPKAVEELLQPAYFVPPGKPAGELLRAFQSKRAHLAIILDEYGTVQGLVTMQDVLEALFQPVGREDEYQAGVTDIERLTEGVFRVPARLGVIEFNRHLAPVLPEGDTYTTVAGYIFHLFGRLPEKGDQVSDGHWTFHVSGLEGTRLTQVTATRRDRRATTRQGARALGLSVTAGVPTVDEGKS